MQTMGNTRMRQPRVQTERGQPDAEPQNQVGPVPREGQAPSERPHDNKSRYMPVDPKGLSQASQLKKKEPTGMESRDSSGPCSLSEELPVKTKIMLESMAPEWRNSWQRRFRGNMATLNSLMWIAT